MKVRYIGDPNDRKKPFAGPDTIEEAGMTFVKGKWTTVPDDHPRAAKLKGNQTFEVEGDDRPKVPVESDEEGEVESLRAELDSRGVTYRKNANAAALRRLLESNTVTGADSEVEDAPPVPAK